MTDSGAARRNVAPLFSDTSPDAEAELIRLLRQAPPWRKLHVVGQLNETVRTLVLSGLRAPPQGQLRGALPERGHEHEAEHALRQTATEPAG